jgi:Cu-Zn family superoxide dismutase
MQQGRWAVAVATGIVWGCEPGGSENQQVEPVTPAGEVSPLAQDPAPQDRFGDASADRGTSGAPRSPTAAAEQAPLIAHAELEPSSGSSVTGTAEFSAAEDGSVMIVARVEGLEPGTSHGVHIHEVGDCSAPDASSAGAHFAPEESPHGAPREDVDNRHAGDLGNLTANQQGVASKELQDAVLSLDGAYSVVGRAIVVHEGEDDLSTQPSGESGDPVACGVIRLAEDMSADGESAA